MPGSRYPLTTAPFTYVIDYGDHNGYLDRADEFLARVAQAPPHLLHVGHDVPLPNTAGALVFRDDGSTHLLTPAEVQDRRTRVAEFLRRIHELGVGIVIPYICNQTIGGDPARRLGVWEFYDHWDDYAALGLGPRPTLDPTHWLARERNGEPHFNYEMRHSTFTERGMYRLAPCANNPHYNAYQRVIVTEIARAGYDGVFVDNCNLNCYCEYCQAKFGRYLAEKYSTQELGRRFGVAEPAGIALGYRGSAIDFVKYEPTFKEFLSDTFSDDELVRWLGTADLDQALIAEGGNGWLWGRARQYRNWMEQRHSPREMVKRFGAPDLSEWGLRTPEDRALWAETKLFWASSIRDNLAFIKRVGTEVRGDFYVLPNWGQMQAFDATEFREEIGHIAESWAPGFDAMMYEEDGEPGRVAHGLYLDHLLQQKLALALGIVGTVMSSRGLHEGTDELAHAQALSAGGGAYIYCGRPFGANDQVAPRAARTRARYRAFFEQNGGLLAGARSYAEIAVACLFRELHMENRDQLRQVFQVTRYLADQHALFDLVVEKQLDAEILREYRVLVLPEARYLSEAEVGAVREFANAGGVVVLTGDSGDCDDAGKPRTPNAFASLLSGGRRGRDGLVIARGGRVIHAADVASLIGASRLSREDALTFAMYSAASLNVPGGRSAAAVYELDRVIGVDRYYEPGRLIPRIERVLGHRVRVTEGRAAAGVRFHAYRKGGVIILHAVNYNVPILDDARERTVEPVARVPVTLPLPEDFAVNEVALQEVGGAECAVAFRISGQCLRFTIPDLRIHQMATIR